MNKQKISVIVPVYNSAPWLHRCIDSIINQTYKNLEIILINDGSTDDSPIIIENYKKVDSRIITVHQENSGLVKSRDVGIKIATGDYITFVDSDDAIDLNIYERLLNNALNYNADISHCGMRFCYENGKEILHYGSNKILECDTRQGLIELLNGNLIEPSLCNKLYAYHLMPDSCPDQSIINNEDLLRNFVLFSRAKKSVFDDFCGYQYYQRENSMSSDKQQVKISKHIYNARKIIVDNSTDEVKPFAVRSWLGSIVTSINILNFSKEEDAKEYCKFCRHMLIQEKNHIRLLKKSQQISALLYIISPTIHKIVYSIYKKMRNTNE